MINDLELVKQLKLIEAPLVGDSVAVYSHDQTFYLIVRVTDRIWFEEEGEVELLCDVNDVKVRGDGTGVELLKRCGFA